MNSPVQVSVDSGKPGKRKLKNDLAALGPVPLDPPEGRPKRIPRAAAKKAQENVAALPENDPTGQPLPPALQSSPMITAKPRLKYENGFVEPDLAVPKPGFLGHTLESFPPAKAKRVASGKGKKGRKVTARPDVSEETEQKYLLHLQTPKLELLSQESELRTKRKLQVIEIPATPLSSSPGRLKRLKITSPKKPPALLSHAAPEEAEETDDNSNDDYCSTCGGTGVFICCESCPKSFHLLCCNPPLQEIPEENWNCTECVAKHGLIPRKQYKGYGMFGPLLDDLHGKNPTEFRLPKKLRDLTFMEVTTGEDFEYADGSMKPEPPKGTLNGFNQNDETDFELLCDSLGSPRLCHKCKMSGMQRRIMVSCDFCPLWWHLDCLPGVVCLAKTIGQKWRCPNHVESIVPAYWLERRSFKDAVILDASVHNNFLLYVQANNFLIKYKDEPYLLKDVTLQEYRTLGGPFQDFSNIGPFEQKYGNFSRVESDDDDDVDEDYKVPGHMQNYAIGGRIMAKSSKKSARVLLMTTGVQPFIYRVPEQNIVVDFVNSTKRGQILKDIAFYEKHTDSERKQDMDAINVLLAMGQKDKEKVRDLNENPQKLNGVKVKEVNDEDLEDAVVNGENVNEWNGLNGNGSEVKKLDPQRTLEGQEDNAQIDLEEIRRLIALKGKDKLMEFLLS